MERDPVCGMQVDPARAAAQVEHGGKRYYFCGRGCAQKFQADPEKYLSGSATNQLAVGHAHAEGHASGQLLSIPPAHSTGALAPLRSNRRRQTRLRVQINHRERSLRAPLEYTCPMHPDVRIEVERGKNPPPCPECGMALEALAAGDAGQQETEYVCPMHPEIVRDAPGDCPICGMALEPRTATLANRRILN